jgi:hypothetical protein
LFPSYQQTDLILPLVNTQNMINITFQIVRTANFQSFISNFFYCFETIYLLSFSMVQPTLELRYHTYIEYLNVGASFFYFFLKKMYSSNSFKNIYFQNLQKKTITEISGFVDLSVTHYDSVFNDDKCRLRKMRRRNFSV